MAKKQTRRSISINRSLFELAKSTAAEEGVSLSEMTEAALRHQIASLRPRKPPTLPKPSDGVPSEGG